MRFSQRIGKTPARTSLQTEEMDDYLRNGLWNVFVAHFISTQPTHKLTQSPLLTTYYRGLWGDFFKWRIDQLSGWTDQNDDVIRAWFYEAQWYEVYDFLEFLVQSTPFPKKVRSLFAEKCNDILERELSGWRFVGTQLVQITDKHEIQGIKDAMRATKGAKFAAGEKHLETAMSLLFRRQSPDPRNSIKEAISAVESVAGVISGKRKATLGDALTVLEKRHKLHPALKNAFSSLYGYTCDADGIRHALTEDQSCDSADARYMLVTCAAFVNFLICKYSGLPTGSKK